MYEAFPDVARIVPTLLGRPLLFGGDRSRIPGELAAARPNPFPLEIGNSLEIMLPALLAETMNDRRPLVAITNRQAGLTAVGVDRTEALAASRVATEKLDNPQGCGVEAARTNATLVVD